LVSRANGKTLASYEKITERDVEDAIDKRTQRIRYDTTRASTSEHSRSLATGRNGLEQSAGSLGERSTMDARQRTCNSR
jgi:acyl-CoA reductase-like NAD-dependent aldehyde dehydrogenase